jgi:hypothetical protein
VPEAVNQDDARLGGVHHVGHQQHRPVPRRLKAGERPERPSPHLGLLLHGDRHLPRADRAERLGLGEERQRQEDVIEVAFEPTPQSDRAPHGRVEHVGVRRVAQERVALDRDVDMPTLRRHDR